jgi:hypothetical protein
MIDESGFGRKSWSDRGTLLESVWRDRRKPQNNHNNHCSYSSPCLSVYNARQPTSVFAVPNCAVPVCRMHRLLDPTASGRVVTIFRIQLHKHPGKFQCCNGRGGCWVGPIDIWEKWWKFSKSSSMIESCYEVFDGLRIYCASLHVY